MSILENDVQKLTQTIIAHNEQYITYYTSSQGRIINAEIHKIDPSRAPIIAQLIIDNAIEKLDGAILYLASVICAESLFDEQCINRNLVEHNGVVSFEGCDYGICQFSGYYLPDRPGMAGLTESQMLIKVYTAEWSIPVMAITYADNVKQAIVDLPSVLDVVEKLNTTELSHEHWLAALYYNAGRDGGLNAIKTLDYSMMKHPYSVAKWYSTFLKEFGI